MQNQEKTVIPKFYSPLQVAELLNISKPTIMRRIRDGTLPARRFPGHRQWRISEEDLRDYIDRADRVVPGAMAPTGTEDAGAQEG